MKKNIKVDIIGSTIFMLSILLIAMSCKTSIVLKDNNQITPWYVDKNDIGDSILSVFESRVPCPDCERLKIALAVYGNPKIQLPSTYAMARVYVGKNNERIINSGKIIVRKGTSLDPSHIVYHLETGAPPEFQDFWKINDSILFVLNEDLSPKVGDAGQGYAINRVK